MENFDWNMLTNHMELIAYVVALALTTLFGGAGLYYVRKVEKLYKENDLFRYAVDFAYSNVQRQARTGEAGNTASKAEAGIEQLRKFYQQVNKQVSPEMEAKALAEFAKRHEAQKERTALVGGGPGNS